MKPANPLSLLRSCLICLASATVVSACAAPELTPAAPPTNTASAALDAPAPPVVAAATSPTSSAPPASSTPTPPQAPHAANASSRSLTIVIIRHAEKPPQGFGQLTCQGLNRSLALAPLLLQKYGKPVAIFATNPSQLKKDSGVPYPYIRPLATVEPLAIRMAMPVDIRWGMTEIEPLATELLKAHSGTEVVAWEHHWAETLARRLLTRMGGAPAQVPVWDDADYDSAYVIRAELADDGFRHVRFAREPQGLDGMPTACATTEPRR